MKCVKCGRNVGSDGFCTCCGFDNKHIAKACNTANYYYNSGLEKVQMRDMSGAVAQLKKALSYNKAHKDARNLLGLVYYEMGEGGKAYIEWRISARLNCVEENQANRYIKDMEEHPAIFEEINETAKKFNQAVTYAKQGSDDLAMIQIKKVLSITPHFVDGHLLFALLHMRAGDEAAAKVDLKHALSIDAYNMTARRFLSELGENPLEVRECVSDGSMKPDSDNLKNVRPVDHYEDPSRETWKQFLYILIGLAIGVVAMIVLVIPSVRAGVRVDYNKLKTEYTEMEEEKDSEISQLQEDKEKLQKRNKKLNNSLSVYEGSDGEDSMYDSLLLATQAYSDGNYIECAQYLENVDKDSLPSEVSQNLYTSMKDTVYSAAASDLYNSGQDLYNNGKYEDALKDLEEAYAYSDSSDYETLYLIGMCYKRLGDMDTATPYFYEIINQADDSDVVRRAANYGLDMTIASARTAAESAAGSTGTGETEGGAGDGAQGDAAQNEDEEEN